MSHRPAPSGSPLQTVHARCSAPDGTIPLIRFQWHGHGGTAPVAGSWVGTWTTAPLVTPGLDTQPLALGRGNALPCRSLWHGTGHAAT
ncbi:hypothetical protein F1645_14050 [Novacetimonas hansenii]|uniref:hypothetical protein n=1 Tax=Novacetimonas hansenii TaxID=436 RepID=UPI0011DD6FA1